MVDLALPPQQEGESRIRREPEWKPRSGAERKTEPPAAGRPVAIPALPSPIPAREATVHEQPAPEQAPAALPETKPAGQPVSPPAGRAVAASGNGGQQGSAASISGARGSDLTASAGSGPPSGRAIEGVFGTTNGPAFIEKAAPVYPRFAQRLGREGTVLLRLFIDENGTLTNVEVVERGGHGFDEVAVSAVKASRFKPARQGSLPVPCRALLPIRFKLEN